MKSIKLFASASLLVLVMSLVLGTCTINAQTFTKITGKVQLVVKDAEMVTENNELKFPADGKAEYNYYLVTDKSVVQT